MGHQQPCRLSRLVLYSSNCIAAHPIGYTDLPTLDVPLAAYNVFDH
jgi:hypothetical protein